MTGRIMRLTYLLMSKKEVWLCKNRNPIFKFYYTDVTQFIKIKFWGYEL